ncbi:MAG: DUF2207 domain-containing protein [Candidatus Saccharibacteria bacterium]
MKKIIILFMSFLVSLSLLGEFGATAHAVGVTNNFTINSYQIDYSLGRDTEGHSTLKTVEKITALFPSSDQNHGIERAIPQSYDNHTTHLVVEAVTDGLGKPLTYSTYSSNDNKVIRIGDSAKFVHGLQQYEITYTQQDVTKYFPDNKTDEFYWDTNGTEWLVPIQSLTVNLHIQADLMNALNGSTSCYQGGAGSTNRCESKKTADGLSISASNLTPHQNATLAIGFQSQTFSSFKATPYEQIVVAVVALGKWSLIFSFIPAVIWLLILIFRYRRQSNRASEHTTIVPEYLPPKDASVTVSASILNKTQAVFSAQLIDFAVRHYIKIYQTRVKSMFKQARYELEITKDIADLRDEEQEILRDIFPATNVGTRLKMEDLERNKIALSLALGDNTKKLDASIRGIYGLRTKNLQQSTWFKWAAIITLIVAILTLSLWLFAVALICLVLSFKLWPLSDRGLELFQYLSGLKMYINTAEVDRLRTLQSPEGSEKLDVTIVDVNDPRQLVKLYERVLPYAILFGLEKDWNKQLGRYYESLNQSPDWYLGSGPAFSAVGFSDAISSFNSVAATSSAASGSGGGGSSGGGGGGGGGGGW